MYITIDNIIGEKMIYLAYPIRGKEVAIVSMCSENIQYEFTEPWMIELESRNEKVTTETYSRQELIDLVEGKIELTR